LEAKPILQYGHDQSKNLCEGRFNQGEGGSQPTLEWLGMAWLGLTEASQITQEWLMRLLSVG
jgi:hypothetical protein